MMVSRGITFGISFFAGSDSPLFSIFLKNLGRMYTPASVSSSEEFLLFSRKISLSVPGVPLTQIIANACRAPEGWGSGIVHSASHIGHHLILPNFEVPSFIPHLAIEEPGIQESWGICPVSHSKAQAGWLHSPLSDVSSTILCPAAPCPCLSPPGGAFQLNPPINSAGSLVWLILPTPN